MVMAFVIGCVIGSFSHVVGMRLPQQQNWLLARSACPKCQRVLRPYELLPIISYLLQLGRCRSCKQIIPARYVMIEVFSGVWSMLFFWQHSISFHWLMHLFIVMFCVVIIVADWLYMLVPNRVLLFFGVPLCIITSAGQSLYSMIGGAAVGFCMLYTIYRLTKGLGAGDVKLVAILGAIVQLEQLFFMLTVACIIGFIIVFVRRATIIPFAPALCSATLLTLFIDDMQFFTFY